ncbi:ferrochelatase [Acidocella aminolytica]|uniref:Ferrochelatase n=1 Tax=Acidocella aminolytica 101 = DSM 11237 TaxID=1120923 RepID=A0A0D6PDG1_9PROT|nr:ferrochelatase [Acidocella aminolytica]GAN79692.1 ferrochelatase [Acidocella aminolytica 101 = DSM 11237]GBQ40330.1 ferrochelatase [Acidocella aminolytica 101 = DSM 11237]SHF04499.1 ferrochelatase [Acidocella aminolytica 101 = DSM 11237]
MRTAVVLFNLGGPDRPEAIKPFRVNLFSDKAIIRAPWFIRVWLSRLIAASSAKAAYENYQLMGGKSPLLELTEKQGRALEAQLGAEYRCFIAMRYWHPFARETVQEVKAWAPDRVLLLPLYPQFSSTTTGSSLADWREAAAWVGLMAPVTTLCCWYDDPAYIAATAAMVREAIEDAMAQQPGLRLRVLFSAHGLPESIVRAGDPYQAEVEASCEAVMAHLADTGVEGQVCYQSRATPQKWLEPSTIDAITQAGKDKVGVVVVPIAFVSDHIETLVELDIENRHVAEEAGVPVYARARVANDDPDFIRALAGIVRRAAEPGLCRGGTACGAHKDCPWEKTIAP